MSYQAPPNGFRTFLIVWATQSLSVFGTALTFFAVNIWLTQTLYPLPEQKPALAWALAANALAFALPAVFGAPLAGAWADRHSRRRTMMAMDFANGCLSLLLVALLVTHTPRELQGRVFAVRTMIAQVTISLGTVLAGWASSVFNPGAVVAVLSAFLVIFCVAQLLNPVLLRVEDKAWLDQMAARAEIEPACRRPFSTGG